MKVSAGGRGAAALAAVAVSLLATQAAGAHEVPRSAVQSDGAEGVPGMSERQLRAFETKTLGPEHAAEHARERALEREDPEPQSNVPRAAIPTSEPQDTGAWAKALPIPAGVIGIHAIMLPTGKVLWFSYPHNPRYDTDRKRDPNKYDVSGNALLWNPATGKFKSVPPPLWDAPGDGTSKKVPANIWCAGQAFMADGRVLIVGGNLAYPSKSDDPANKNDYWYQGLNQAYTFDPWTEKWQREPDMQDGRWYPTTLLMPDGKMLIMGGLDSEKVHKDTYSSNKQIEVFDPATRTMTRLDKDRNGGATVVGGVPPDGGLYPHLFWMKNPTGTGGHVLVAGPDRRDSWRMPEPSGNATPTATDNADPSLFHVWGSGVLVPDGPGGSSRVMLIGGAGYDPNADGNIVSTGQSEVYDDATDTWSSGPALNVPRGHLNTVVLPDRTLLSVGGGIGSVGVDRKNSSAQWGVTGQERQTELLRPGSSSWTLGAAQAENRAYHSTALLMPDARVVSAGDDFSGPQGPGTGETSDTAEVYSPPYLFNPNGTAKTAAQRPAINSSPTHVTWGQGFDISTSPTATSAVLVAPGATTHANDMSQRLVPLQATPTTGGLHLTAPPSADVALPSCYMLFTLDAQGTPSVARWIQLNGGGATNCGKAGPPDPKGPISTAKPGAPAVTKPAKPVKPAPARDRTGPVIAFSARTGLDGRRGIVKGRVRDGSGVARVQVAIRRRKGRVCSWFSATGRRFKRGGCSKPRWIRTRLRRAGARLTFSARLHRRVRRGYYAVSVRATDKLGNTTNASGRHRTKARVRR